MANETKKTASQFMFKFAYLIPGHVSSTGVGFGFGGKPNCKSPLAEIETPYCETVLLLLRRQNWSRTVFFAVIIVYFYNEFGFE